MLFSALLPVSDHHTSSRALKIVMRCVMALVLLALLVGCGTTKPVQPVVVEQEKVVVKVPASLTTPLKPAKVISREEYLALSLEDREDYLTMYSIHLQGVINMANNRLATIKKLYGDKP